MPTTWCASSSGWRRRPASTSFRVFDALNDPRNLAAAIAAVQENGKWVEGTISYTKSPVHNVPSFLAYAGKLAEMGAQSICIKDMAGLLDPQDAYELVSALKSAYPDVLVHMHSHYTSGMASMAYLKAVEAGADILDCAISSMSMGTSHPPTESMVAALAGTDRATGMDIGLLEDISEYFRDVRKKYVAYESAFTAVDPAVLLWQIPGGMISNLSSQLKEQGQLERMPEVLAEVPRVRQEFGYPPLVTPTSQIVGTQATLNVLMGRYKMITKESKAYMQGFYGLPPGPVDLEVQKLCIGDETPITTRPADSLEPELPKRRAELEEQGIKFSEEDLLSYALFPQVALEFFARRDRAERPRAEIAALAAAAGRPVGRERRGAARLGRQWSWQLLPEPAQAGHRSADVPVRGARVGLGRSRAPRSHRRPLGPAEVLTVKFKINIDSKEHQVEARADGTVVLDGETFAAKVSNPGTDRRMVQVGDTTYEIRTVDDCTDTGIAVLELAGERIPVTVTGVTKGAGRRGRRGGRRSGARCRRRRRRHDGCHPSRLRKRSRTASGLRCRARSSTCGSRWATRWPKAIWCSSLRP